jgi:glutathionyl-hydroquinone reductase
LVKTVLTEQDKRDLKVIAAELVEIRKLVDKLAETLVNLNDEELLKFFNASQDDIKECQVDRYEEALEKQLDVAEKELRS